MHFSLMCVNIYTSGRPLFGCQELLFFALQNVSYKSESLFFSRPFQVFDDDGFCRIFLLLLFYTLVSCLHLPVLTFTVNGSFYSMSQIVPGSLYESLSFKVQKSSIVFFFCPQFSSVYCPPFIKKNFRTIPETR